LEKHFGQKKNSVKKKKDFSPKKILVEKNFWSQKFTVENIFDPKKMFGRGPRKKFG